jgi:hypothetical protein
MVVYDDLPDNIKYYIRTFIPDEGDDWVVRYLPNEITMCDYECNNSTPLCTDACLEYYNYLRELELRLEEYLNYEDCTFCDIFEDFTFCDIFDDF